MEDVQDVVPVEEDPAKIKANLLRWQSTFEEPTDSIKEQTDMAMFDKEFLQEAQNSINLYPERPELRPLDPRQDDFVFFCIDVDFYIDNP